MKRLDKQVSIIAIAMMASGVAQAGDMDGAVAYSLGEFDRVGVSQPMPKAQADKRNPTQKQSAASAAQSAQDRQLAVRKAEFVRRMFWLALSAR